MHRHSSQRPGRSAGVAVALAALGCMAAAAGEEGGRYALLVGVEKYNPKFLEPLDHAEDDMERVGEALAQLGFNVVTMTSAAELPERRPTLAADIVKEVDRRLKGRAPADTIVLAFSGHGMQLKADAPGPRGERETWFCPERARPDDPTTLLPLSAVLEKLKACPARQKLLLVDACRVEVEPKAIRDKSGVPMVELDAAAPFRGRIPEGMAALFSCSPHQKSYELPDTGGVFTHYVLEYLAGKADPSRYHRGAPTVQELAAYVSRQTKDLVDQRLAEDQIPELVLPDGRFTDWSLGALGRATSEPLLGDVGLRLRHVLNEAAAFDAPCVAISSDGRLVAVEEMDHADRQQQRASGRARIGLWDGAHGRRLRTIDAHAFRVGGLAFSDCGTWISSGGHLEEKTVRVWNVKTGDLQCETAQLPWSLFGQPRFFGEGIGADLLFQLSDGRIIRLEVGSGGAVDVFAGIQDTSWDAVFSADGRLAILGCQDGVKAVDLAGERILWEKPLGPDTTGEIATPVDAVAIDSQGRTALVAWHEQRHRPAAADGETWPTTQVGLAAVAADTGEILNRFLTKEQPLPLHRLRKIRYLGTRRAISCDNKGTVVIWDLQTGRAISQKSTDATELGVSADGRRIVLSGKQSVSVWDVDL